MYVLWRTRCNLQRKRGRSSSHLHSPLTSIHSSFTPHCNMEELFSYMFASSRKASSSASAKIVPRLSAADANLCLACFSTDRFRAACSVIVVDEPQNKIVGTI